MALMRALLPAVPWVMLAITLWRWLVRREPPEALAERMGHLPAPAGPAIWLHGASNGELASARWVLEEVLAARPGLYALVTTNTATARAMVADWALPRVTAAFAPLDLDGPLRRVLNLWQPLALITVEGEIYPRRFALCAGRPIALIGARMSERSYRGWRDLHPVMARALAQVTLCSAQDDASARRLRNLGLPASAVRAPCDLKAVAIARLPVPEPSALPRSRWLLAASTHAGEEEIVLRAFSAARDRFDHLILAPRHPRRALEVAALIAAAGLRMQQRSSGALPGDSDVFLADTMGEMDLWYARCGTCLVGGSLVPRGGHTPWEPARFGCAILHGPHVANFAGPYAALADGGGAVALAGPEELGPALRGLDPQRQASLGQTAARILRDSAGDVSFLHNILMLLPATD
jgi:3-deoxy-D-manno-octulosonic-acid transferase